MKKFTLYILYKYVKSQLIAHGSNNTVWFKKTTGHILLEHDDDFLNIATTNARIYRYESLKCSLLQEDLDEMFLKFKKVYMNGMFRVNVPVSWMFDQLN